MDWDWNAVKVLVDLAQFIVLGFVGWWQWQLRQKRVSADDRDERERHQDEGIKDLDVRTTAIEQQIEGMPTHRDMGRLYDRINTVAGEMHKAVGTMEALNHQLQLLHEDRITPGRRRE